LSDGSEETLPLRGYNYEQGSNPTHEALICTLHERGENEADIAKKTQHQLKSVGRYISRYTRVEQLMERGLGNREIAHILGIGERVVLEYNRIAMHFHPELAKKVTLKKKKKRQETHQGTIGPIDVSVETAGCHVLPAWYSREDRFSTIIKLLFTGRADA